MSSGLDPHAVHLHHRAGHAATEGLRDGSSHAWLQMERHAVARGVACAYATHTWYTCITRPTAWATQQPRAVRV